MARFRNTTSSPLDFYEHLGVTVGPFAEFDWLGYDEDIHGAVPGCERLDEPKKRVPKRTRPAGKTGGADENGEAGDDEAGNPPSGDGAGDNDAADKETTS